MNTHVLFGISVAMSFVAFGLVTKIYILPGLRALPRQEALLALVIPHTFRFIGLSFLVPGVVAPTLPPAFAVPVAYGDLVAAALATAAVLAMITKWSWALGVVWAFNLWGTADLLHAIYQGQIGVGIDPSELGAAFFIPTVIVPPLLVTQGLIFLFLPRTKM